MSDFEIGRRNVAFLWPDNEISQLESNCKLYISNRRENKRRNKNFASIA